MRTRLISAIFLLTTVFVGCKDEKSVDNLQVVKPEVVAENFKVVIDVIVKKDDDFALYYTMDGSINFFTIQPVWQSVKGNENVQQVTFYLPEDVQPTELRMDFGMKPDQPDVILKGFTLSYNGKTFHAEGQDVFKYFEADKNQCSVDIPTGTIKANIKEGKRVTPSLYPIPTMLGPQIDILTK